MSLKTSNPFDAFIYELLRDHMYVGELNDIIGDQGKHEDQAVTEWELTDDLLAQIAARMTNELMDQWVHEKSARAKLDMMLEELEKLGSPCRLIELPSLYDALCRTYEKLKDEKFKELEGTKRARNSAIKRVEVLQAKIKEFEEENKKLKDRISRLEDLSKVSGAALDHSELIIEEIKENLQHHAEIIWESDDHKALIDHIKFQADMIKEKDDQISRLKGENTKDTRSHIWLKKAFDDEQKRKDKALRDVEERDKAIRELSRANAEYFNEVTELRVDRDRVADEMNKLIAKKDEEIKGHRLFVMKVREKLGADESYDLVQYIDDKMSDLRFYESGKRIKVEGNGEGTYWEAKLRFTTPRPLEAIDAKDFFYRQVCLTRLPSFTISSVEKVR